MDSLQPNKGPSKWSNLSNLLKIKSIYWHKCKCWIGCKMTAQSSSQMANTCYGTAETQSHMI
jgi:hypothetical protein